MTRLLAVVFIALAGAAFGDEIRVQVDRNRVGVEDTVQLSVILEGSQFSEVSPRIPELKNLAVGAGPWASTMDSFVNGKHTHTRTYSWLLKPQATGEAWIYGLRWEGSGTSGTTREIKIEVVPGSLGSGSRQQDPFGSFFQSPFDRQFERERQQQPPPDDALFVTAEFNRPSAFAGQQLLLTYSLYIDPSVEVTGIQLDSAPSYGGFWVEDLREEGAQTNGENVNRGGRVYRRYVVARKALFPLRAGRLGVKSVPFTAGVRQRGRNPFDRLLGGGGIEATALKSAAVSIAVRPLPAGAPASFQGAVGAFDFAATMPERRGRVGAALTLDLKIAGRGAVRGLEAPRSVAIEGARLYPPSVTSHQDVRDATVYGTKTWSYVVVPERAGALRLPALEWSYFDPDAERYLTRTTPAIDLAIEADPAGQGEDPAEPGGERAASLRRGALHGLSVPVPLWRQRAVLEVEIVGFVVFAALLLALTWMLRRRGAARGAALQAAGPEPLAIGALRASPVSAGKERLAAHVETVVRDVLGERYGIPNHLPVGQWSEHLRRQGVNPKAAADLVALMGELSAIKHAPQLAAYDADLANLPERARRALENLRTRERKRSA